MRGRKRLDLRIAQLEKKWKESPFLQLGTKNVPPDLPEPYRGVLESRINGISMSKIGSDLGITRQAVAQIQSKAFRLLGIGV